MPQRAESSQQVCPNQASRRRFSTLRQSDTLVATDLHSDLHLVGRRERVHPHVMRRTLFSPNKAGVVDDVYEGQTASHWRNVLLNNGHFKRQDLDGMNAKQVYHINQALNLASAEHVGALGLVMQQAALNEGFAQEAEQRVRLCEEEIELMTRERETQAAVTEHEDELLRIELNRAHDESRNLAHVRELWAATAMENVDLAQAVDHKEFEKREEIARIRGQLSSLHSMLEEELRSALTRFRSEYRDNAFEQLDDEVVALGFGLHLPTMYRIPPIDSLPLTARLWELCHRCPQAQTAILESRQVSRSAEDLNRHTRKLQVEHARTSAPAAPHSCRASPAAPASLASPASPASPAAPTYTYTCP